MRPRPKGLSVRGRRLAGEKAEGAFALLNTSAIF
jgi:hypothetical protein